MLDETSPDIVVLATPSGLHHDQACVTAGAGCHVVTERPMATAWLDARSMVAACDGDASLDRVVAGLGECGLDRLAA
jgi:UDP-N-acetyl-2-amino-2-deoxyglucuronate dehydrogenase